MQSKIHTSFFEDTAVLFDLASAEDIVCGCVE